MIDTDSFKKRLEEEKTRLEKQLAQDGEKDETTGEWEGSSEKLETEPAIDPNVAADQMEELANNIPIVENLETRLHEVTAALERIADGTYGKCSVCGEPIPDERLEANPAATTCIAHA